MLCQQLDAMDCFSQVLHALVLSVFFAHHVFDDVAGGVVELVCHAKLHWLDGQCFVVTAADLCVQRSGRGVFGGVCVAHREGSCCGWQ